MDANFRARQRNGTLAEQLADEVRRGEPEKARLLSYLGCEQARTVIKVFCKNCNGSGGGVVDCSECDGSGSLGGTSLLGFIGGVRSLASDIKDLSVPFDQWLLVGAACKVSREVEFNWFNRNRHRQNDLLYWQTAAFSNICSACGGSDLNCNNVCATQKTVLCENIDKALNAAEAWVLEPSGDNLLVCEKIYSDTRHRLPRWCAGALYLVAEGPLNVERNLAWAFGNAAEFIPELTVFKVVREYGFGVIR